MTGLLKLNLGCGPVQPPGWVNADGSNRAWLATRIGPLDRALTALRLLPRTEFGANVYVNLFKPLPWPTDSASAVYLGEVLEHFTREDGESLLRECRRVLAPGGVLRVRVPDTLAMWGRYADELRETLAHPRDRWTLKHVEVVRMFFRDIATSSPGRGSWGHFHKWAYDEVSLILLFESLGFREVARRGLHDSRIPGVEVVENRYDLIVEGVK
ncbi:MAG TPA: methyltransferase domain-containing protein [Gemmata sp.]|nr:methyltransferase domain-containing protein [Gemmata sp.]